MSTVEDGIYARLGISPPPGPLFEWQRFDDATWSTDADRSRALISIVTVYGRTDGWSKVVPVQATVSAAIPRAGACPETGELFRIRLNQTAAAELDLDGQESVLFTGEVTDPHIDPRARTWQVIAVHTIARKARVTVDLTAAGTQTPADRVEAILADCGAASIMGTIDADEPADPDLAAPDAPSPARSLLDLVTDSTLGQLVAQLDGTVDWHGPGHRRGAVTEVVLTPDEILNDLTWDQHVSTVVNSAQIAYVGGTELVEDDASITERGPYPTSVGTALTTDDDAASLGSLIVGRRNTPTWDLPTLHLDVVRSVTEGNRPALLKLRHGSAVNLDELPTGVGSPVVGDHNIYVEGFTHTITRYAWLIGISGSDPTLSGVVIRWMDVDPDLTWGDVDPDLRWLDLARILDGDGLGDDGSSPGSGGDLDGGAAGASFDRTIDGGDASTSTFTDTYDGGAAA